MKSLSVLSLLFGMGLSVTGTADGQIRPEPWTDRQPASSRLHRESLNVSPLGRGSELTTVWRDVPSYPRVAVGTTIGGVLGGAAGLAIVAATREKPADASMFPWVDLAAGGVLGSTTGMYLGARMSSGGQGNPWLTGAAAVGGTALGVLGGLVIGDLLSQGTGGKVPEILGTAIGISIPLGVTSFVEWKASR
jgi:hypothetical protein